MKLAGIGIVLQLIAFAVLAQAPSEPPPAVDLFSAPIPRISSPANGIVIAVDPDIPPAHQKLPISTEGATQSMRLKLNGHELARADGVTLWTPQVGAYALELGDEQGKVLDRVVFTVR